MARATVFVRLCFDADKGATADFVSDAGDAAILLLLAPVTKVNLLEKDVSSTLDATLRLLVAEPACSEVRIAEGSLEGVKAGVESGLGGFVLAELSSLGATVAAPGPLPATGTAPTCFDVKEDDVPFCFVADDDEVACDG